MLRPITYSLQTMPPQARWPCCPPHCLLILHAIHQCWASNSPRCSSEMSKPKVPLLASFAQLISPVLRSPQLPCKRATHAMSHHWFHYAHPMVVFTSINQRGVIKSRASFSKYAISPAQLISISSIASTSRLSVVYDN